MADSAKVINRVLHFVSTGFLAGTTVFNYVFGTNEYLREELYYKQVHITAGVLVIVTGIANIILIARGIRLQREMNQKSGIENATSPSALQAKENQSTWKFILYLKLAITLLLTPAIEPLVIIVAGGFDTDAEKLANLRQKLQFYIVIGLLIMSVLIKSYREDFSNNFLADPFESKFTEF